MISVIIAIRCNSHPDVLPSACCYMGDIWTPQLAFMCTQPQSLNVINISNNNIVILIFFKTGRGPSGAWAWDDHRHLPSGRGISMRRRRRRRRRRGGKRRWTSEDNRERWAWIWKLKMRKWEVHPFKEESRSNFPHSSSRDTLGIAQLVTWVVWDESSVMEEIDIQNVKWQHCFWKKTTW